MKATKAVNDTTKTTNNLETDSESDVKASRSGDWFRRFLTFVAVGLAATALHGLIAWILVNTLGSIPANTIGFIAALGITYAGNYRFTFRSDADHTDTVIRFLVVSAVTFALSQWVLWFLRSMGADERTSLLVAVIAIPLMRFGVLATQVFTEPMSRKPLVPWLLDIGVWVVAVGVGIIALLAVVPDGFLDAGSEVWRLPSGDRGTGVVGMRYYLADDWHWPPLLTDDLSFPEGTNIVFTDSIPLMALGAKLARPIIGSDINYFPSWFILIYSLQGVGGVALLKSLGVKRRDALVTGAILAVTFPAFVYRGIHPALDAHFIMLFTLAAAFASGAITESNSTDSASADSASRVGSIGSTTPGRWQVATGVLLIITLLIHPYLLIMITPLVAGVFVDHWRSGRLTIRQIATLAEGSLAGLFAVLYVGGYVGTHGGASGYGEYGLNLLAPIYPQLSGILPGEQPVLVAGGPKGWEAFNWFGFGALGLFVAAAALVSLKDRGLPRRSLGLLFSMVLLTALAVSQTINYGSNGVFDLDSLAEHPLSLAAGVGILSLVLGAFWLIRRPSRTATKELAAVVGLCYVGGAGVWLLGARLISPLGIVRASGRLWWPVGLLLVLGSVAVVARSSSRVLLIPLALAAAVQIVDTGPVRDEAAATMVDSVAIPGSDALLAAVGNSSQVRVSPSFHCAQELEDSWAALDAIVVAAERGVPIDTAYTARIPKGYECGSETEAALAPGELRVLVMPNRLNPGVLIDELHRCRDNGRLLACTDQWAGLDAGAVAPFLPVVAEPISFAAGADSQPVMTNGWGEAQEWGQVVPTAGASVSIPLIGVEPGDELIIRFRLRRVDEKPGAFTLHSPQFEDQIINVSELQPDNYEVQLAVDIDSLDPLSFTMTSRPDGPLIGIESMTVMLANPEQTLAFSDED